MLKNVSRLNKSIFGFCGLSSKVYAFFWRRQFVETKILFHLVKHHAQGDYLVNYHGFRVPHLVGASPKTLRYAKSITYYKYPVVL